MEEDDLKFLKHLFDDIEKYIKNKKYKTDPLYVPDEPNWMKDFRWFLDQKKRKLKESKEFIEKKEMEL